MFDVVVGVISLIVGRWMHICRRRELWWLATAEWMIHGYRCEVGRALVQETNPQLTLIVHLHYVAVMMLTVPAARKEVYLFGLHWRSGTYIIFIDMEQI